MVEETGDLVGCQIAEGELQKRTAWWGTHEVANKSAESAQRYETLIDAPLGIPREKYMLQERHQQMVDELRLL